MLCVWFRLNTNITTHTHTRIPFTMNRAVVIGLSEHNREWDQIRTRSITFGPEDDGVCRVYSNNGGWNEFYVYNMSQYGWNDGIECTYIHHTIRNSSMWYHSNTLNWLTIGIFGGLIGGLTFIIVTYWWWMGWMPLDKRYWWQTTDDGSLVLCPKYFMVSSNNLLTMSTASAYAHTATTYAFKLSRIEIITHTHTLTLTLSRPPAIRIRQSSSLMR